MGSPSRAERIAGLLDASPVPFRVATERGFLTITGRYKGVPLSIVSIGMGSAMADFFIREVRECLSGDMVVVRSLPFPIDCSADDGLTDRFLGTLPPGSGPAAAWWTSRSEVWSYQGPASLSIGITISISKPVNQRRLPIDTASR